MSPALHPVLDQYSPDCGTPFYRCVMGDGTPSIHYGIYATPGQPMREAVDAATLRLLGIALAMSGGVMPHEVLDLGAGAGGPAHLVADRTGARVCCVDLCPHHAAENLALAGERGLEGRIETWTGSFDALPVAWSGRFDLVWSQEAICHARDKAAVFREARRALKPGGVFAFSDILLAEDAPPAEAAVFSDVNAVLCLATRAAHLRDLRQAGFADVEDDDWSAWLPENFRRMLDQLECHRGDLLACGVDPARIERFASSLRRRIAWPAGSVMRWGAFACRAPRESGMGQGEQQEGTHRDRLQ